MKKCLTCQEVTKYDQCPSCNPDAFTDGCHETAVTKFYKGLVYVTPVDVTTRIIMLEAMIKSVDEDSKVIPNLCKALSLCYRALPFQISERGVANELR